ncbi:uncharacterized protein BO66DRAFT_375622 [Aspergillus aculeatinus CBS 121060]|uniref:Uncharacterized protein n=1 Tax=Aspergillus aculeatinus CBS 121060 TaxID=1448322 RepID=A0ACD1H7E2_9EURO|nr:hypothetical protein BO66DRAFT_375622 [Aspergillus aculeatinus CBS 121060]RAH69505.1 hypothetical protein BO66DRAFT_375622 [Aspergillus aculeatinus CBS 121060]
MRCLSLTAGRFGRIFHTKFFRVVLAVLAILSVIFNYFPNTSSIRSRLQSIPPDAVSPRKNLILSALDGAKWQDQIFIFMESLDVALGRDALDITRCQNEQQDGGMTTTSCQPLLVEVKIIVPAEVADHPPPGFQILMRRYPFLSFVGALPDSDIPVVARRFQGLSAVLHNNTGEYFDNVLVCDLDVVFQRNPFTLSQTTPPGVELLLFAEWRGLKIGQCNVHQRWFDGCSKALDPPYLSREDADRYNTLDRICAGTTYGTSRAISIYLRTMVAELTKSKYQCNDQATHIHIFYSGILDTELRQAGVGQSELVPNADALLGTVGTTPMVRFNDWGEVLNENGEVQVAIHQYKTHHILSELVWAKYGWLRELEGMEHVGQVPDLEEDMDWTKQAKGTNAQVGYDRHLLRFKLGNATGEYCDTAGKLCSCKYSDCQMDYAEFQ